MAARITKPKPAAKTTSKSGAKSPPRASGKAAAMSPAKSKKAAAKPQLEASPRAKPSTTAQAKVGPAPKGKAAPKAKTKPVAKATPKAKTKLVAKAEPKAKTKPVAKATSKAKTKGASKAAPVKAVKSSAAREALKARAMKQVIAEVIAPIESGRAVVDAYMRDVDHPFKAEMEAVRSIILGASSKISERIKWNAPSFYYKEDLGAFHPRATEYAHLILLFPSGAGIPTKSTLLEGKQKDRREAKFYSLADIESKKPALERLVRDWVALRDA